MPADDCVQRPLFGGAISSSFPMRFQDLSNIQQVPDHQEAFADPSRDESLIIELLDFKHDVEDNGSAVWFLRDLAGEQDAEQSMLLEQSDTIEAPGLRYRDAPSVVMIAVGQMAISKGRQGREAQNIVRVYLANLRLKGVGTDVLITAYEPVFINPLSASARTVGAGPAAPAAESGCLPVDRVLGAVGEPRESRPGEVTYPPIINRYLCSLKHRASHQMARVSNFWSRGRAATAVWIISAILFYFILRAVMENSTSTSPEFAASSSVERSRLYDKMAQDLDEHGLKFLQGGETSQSMSLNDMFELKSGSVTPKHKAADPPVRANVLYLSPEFSNPISQAVRDIFLPYFVGAIWFQNASLFHFSMFHASHHLTPTKATETEIEAEVSAVKAVAQSLCPLQIILDRVVLTSTGVLLGCWQVISGPDPVAIRAKLRNALPRSPEKQLYDPVMLHTSFARILGPPGGLLEETKKPSDLLQFFHELVARVNNKIHGFKATVSELWFVEEYDVLALALDGRMKVHKCQLGCSSH